jgi:phospholipase C
VIEILTKNPEVWKKTIFVLTYDENDGYFDHVPPYVSTHPFKENAGKMSPGLDPKLDFITKDTQTNPSMKADRIRESQIGLGYRVPMMIISPWTRGGYVCSEVFDHTSSLQFLETFLEKKFNKKITEENITPWRRAICGNLTSAFRPYNGEKIEQPQFLDKKAFMQTIYSAKFKEEPDNFKSLNADEISLINENPATSPDFPQQEKGIRMASALPYELYVNGAYENGKYRIDFNAANKQFGKQSAGAPFIVYAQQPFKAETLKVWDYTVAAGDVIQDEWAVQDFQNSEYHLDVHGPNGFFRSFKGTAANPAVSILCRYEEDPKKPGKLTGNIMVTAVNKGKKAEEVVIRDVSYKAGPKQLKVPANGRSSIKLDLKANHNWYDFIVEVAGYKQFQEQFAGRVETGAITRTDPLMGRMV